MNKNDLAHNIFNALFDDEDLNEMHQKGFIAQPLGYQASSVATIELEIDETYDRLQQENTELREFVCSLQLDVSNEIKLEDLLAKLNKEGE